MQFKYTAMTYNRKQSHTVRTHSEFRSQYSIDEIIRYLIIYIYKKANIAMYIWL